ncbi:MAG: biopolymer transporter ExbD [Bacteroidota bacterium]
MQASQNGSGKYRIMSDINMIPFIDICLVLLVIFMIMTPILVKSQLKLDLPSSKSTEPIKHDKDKTVNVQIRKDGAIFVDNEVVTKESIDKVLADKLPDPVYQNVMIEADKTVQFEHVVGVMGSIRKLGCTKIGVAVMPDRPARTSGKKSR